MWILFEALKFESNWSELWQKKDNWTWCRTWVNLVLSLWLCFILVPLTLLQVIHVVFHLHYLCPLCYDYETPLNFQRFDCNFLLVAHYKSLKMHLDLTWGDYQQAVINEYPHMLAGSILGTDVCHWMFKKSQYGSRSTRWLFKQKCPWDLTLKGLNFWKFTSYCNLKPLWSGMEEVVPART